MLERGSVEHNSQNIYYRSTVGAAETESEVVLGIRIRTDEEIKQVLLRTWQDGSGEKLIPMTTRDTGNNKFYSVAVTMPSKGCLLWYYFIIAHSSGTSFYGNKEGPVIEGDVSWKNFSLYCVDNEVALPVFMGLRGNERAESWMDGGTTLKTGGKYVVYVDNDGTQLKQYYCGTYEGLDAWLKKRAEQPYAIYPCLNFGASVDEVRKHIAANDESWIDYGLYQLEGESYWRDQFSIGPNIVEYYFETEDGKKLWHIRYDYLGSTLTSDVMVPQLEEMGFIYKGFVIFPNIPDNKFYLI